MVRTLSEMKIAALVANGFCQKDLVASQRAILEQGANLRIVSSEQGLVNGWQDDTWGHHFAVDAQLNQALSADYDALIVPSGHKSIEKMRLTAHTKRFLNGFISTGKPVYMFGDAANMLVYTENAANLNVSCEGYVQMAIEKAGGFCKSSAVTFDENLMTSIVNDDNRAECVNMMMRNLSDYVTEANRQTIKAA